MADNARKTHVSPGVYSREIDLNYAVKSLGLTTLGLAGETVKGPAFQPISIEDWAHFQDTFGGTNTEKFEGSQYPKYELPYIAKSYLKESKQLEVCRVLGLSGYHAGPAWVITAPIEGTSQNMVVAVIRSRGYYNAYEKYEATKLNCACGLAAYDKLHYYVGEFPQVPECDYATHYNPSALTISEYYPLDQLGDPCSEYRLGGEGLGWTVSESNYGKFVLSGWTGPSDASGKQPADAETFKYAVSLNPTDNNYILKVLGTDPQNGDAPIFVESLFDVALIQGIEETDINKINSGLTFYDGFKTADFSTIPPVDGFLTKEEGSLKKSDVGKRFLYAKAASNLVSGTTAHRYGVDNKGNMLWIDSDYYSGETSGKTQHWVSGATLINNSGTTVTEGQVYTVRTYLDPSNKKHYYYSYPYTVNKSKDDILAYRNQSMNGTLVTKQITSGEHASYGPEVFGTADYLEKGGDIGQPDGVKIPLSAITSYGLKNFVMNKSVLVKNNADGLYYKYYSGGTGASQSFVAPVTCDLSNYKSAYRFASTPWLVSNVKGDLNQIELNKLFRFHTISDGNSANEEIKVSIKNIEPDNLTFDVEVRYVYDTDASPIVYETFSKVNLIPGDKNYIGYRIGTYDGGYESQSKYITVEVNEKMTTQNSVPAGFIGYPLAHYSGATICGVVETRNASGKTLGNVGQSTLIAPRLKYNCDYNQDIKNRKQYFGLSDLVGVDVDAFTYKGESAYVTDPTMLSNGFHLDCRVSLKSYSGDTHPTIYVDGDSGYTFDTVSVNNVTETLENVPVIGTEMEMDGTIYEYKNLRKFTVYFYGGFDGWDVYRHQRSNTDDFKYSQYKGQYNDKTGEGFAFDKIWNPELLGLNQKAITSDWYAYLAAIRKFANPDEIDINVIATPGIDFVNNKTLVGEVIEMVEEERADSIYVMTTPDKPSGAEDYVDEMYDAEDIVDELEDSEIDSNYTTTYFPWVKYFDADNNQYIYLPATKDAVRNMAKTDNIAHPWFAPAGIERGDVECVRAHKITKLADEDVLYEGRINPVKTFATEGVKLWGQKNLQIAESQLNRIAVRRLLLRMRKLVAIACIGLIFEPNDATTKDKFLSTVTPIMDNIRANRGISDYKIEVDDSIEARERRELPAKIFFKPYNALEYVVLDFILTPEGLDFSDL